LAAALVIPAAAAPAAEPARARVNLASLFSDADYPASAVAAREQGEVGFVLDIAASGRVTGCTITRSSGSAALDSTTCRVLGSRARFTPARDSNGRPSPDRMAGRIRWVLPATVPSPG
jgi:protein TonB